MLPSDTLKLSTVAAPVLNVLLPLSILPKPLDIAPAANVPTDVICVCAASTAITEFVAVNPVPENNVAISDGITRLKTLKPYRFNWKTEPDKTVDGFFAHEVTAVPEAIAGVKDAMRDGEIDPQSLDQSKLVPLLTAALQEAISKIEALETKVAALEAA